MSQHYTYTAADFERYHSGKMSEAEMHALEKASLEDPFLADALEGYANANNASKDIAELKQKLFEKKNGENRFFAITKGNFWLKIAAVFVLIAGGGYFIYFLDTDNRKSELSMRDAGMEKKEQPVTAKVNSLSLPDTAKAAFSLAEKKNANVVNNKSRSMISAAISPRQTYPTAKVLQQDKATAMLSRSRVNQAYNRDMNAARDQLADNKDKPNDKPGKMFLKDSAPADYKATAKESNQKAEQEVVVAPSKERTEEVTVTALGMRKARGYSSVPEGKAPGVMVIDSSSLSADKKFNEYVKANVHIPKDATGIDYQGKVILSFEVNKKGKPKKIKVDQSLCGSCDDEAKRLLIEGPKWKYENGKRQTIRIEF